MKKVILTLMILFNFPVFAQIDTLSYTDVIELRFKKEKNYTEVSTYRDKDGFIFTKGMSLKIGIPENPENVSSSIFGERKDGNFSYIFKYKGLVTTADKKFSGENVVIDNMYIFNMKIFKNEPVEIYFECKLEKPIDSIESVHIKDIDKAVSLGEVIVLGKMTREKAIQELKKKKELLDLELITQDEYDEVKAKMLKFIQD